MNTIDVDLPYCNCPHCDAPFRHDEYWLTQSGDEIECPACEKTIHVVWIDHTITARLSTEAD